jgi:Vault protein inter-alpha-trypsin domain
MTTLALRDAATGKKLPLVSLTGQVSIAGGFLAQTEVVAVFSNPSPEASSAQIGGGLSPGAGDAEGEVVFPLPEGAKVSAYAVDVAGSGGAQMLDAVLVEKEVARATFEAEVREKRAGPAVLEQVCNGGQLMQVFWRPC